MLRRTRAAVVVGLGAAMLTSAFAALAAPAAERELLGVRLWRDFATVLRKHGEPTRVVPGIALPPEISSGSMNVNVQMGAPGGMSMGMSGRPMMGSSMGMIGPPGMPQMGGMSSAGGMAPGLAMGGGRSMPRAGGSKSKDEDDSFSGAPSGAGPGGPMGGPAGLSGPGSGMSAPPGLAMGSGMMGSLSMGPGMLGGMRSDLSGAPSAMGGIGSSASARSQGQMALPSEDIKETWVYVRGPHTFQFLFNRDGRVVKIQSFGLKGASRTSRSIALGDPLSRVYGKYGWASSTIKQGASLVLDYSQKAHVIFDLLDRGDGKGLRVVGITIAPSEGLDR